MEQPAARTPRVRGLVLPFYLLNATSLLEASIGVAWQAAFAHAVGQRVSGARQTLLFACLWLVYTADRWLDARKTTEFRPTSYRHRFAVRHQRGLLWVWAVVLLSSLALATRSLLPQEWRSCLLVLGVVLGYTVLVQRSQLGTHWFVRSGAKQLAVAAIFTTGITLFIWPATLPGLLLSPGLAFFGVALLNLLVITEKESQQAPLRGRTAPPRVRRWLAGVVAAAFGAALILPYFLRLPTALKPGLWGALGVSLLALLGLHQAAGKSLTTDTCHALADFALLVPPLAWLWL